MNNINTKANNKGNGNKGNGKQDIVIDANILDAIKKQIAAEQKYKKVNSEGGDFKAENALFNDIMDADDNHSKEIVTSDVPLRMVPILTNWETLIDATNMSRTERLSRKWIKYYLLYRKPLDRQWRAEAVSMGQTRQEENEMNKALRD